MSSIAMTFPPDEHVFRLSVKQYHAMIDAGVLTDDDPVELLEGILVFKMPKKPAHRLALRKLFKAIDPMLPKQFFIQLQEPITLTDGEPEPDAAVISGTDEEFANRHPGPADVPWVIEVSDSTLVRDRGAKLRSYASAGIPIYWIVDLNSRTVERYTDPDPNSGPAIYRTTQVFDAQSVIDVTVDTMKLGEITVSDILP